MKRIYLGCVVALLGSLTVFTFQNCSSGGDSFPSNSSSSFWSGVAGFFVQPQASLLAPNAVLQFSTSGSSGAVTYQLVAGAGAISSSGYYTAPGAAADAVVSATSSSGEVSYAFIKVATSSSLVAVPSSIELAPGQIFPLSAIGGTPPYTFSVNPSTAGSVNGSGIFTAASNAGSATISITDSASNSTSVNVNIVTSAANPITAIYAPNPALANDSATFYISGSSNSFTLALTSGSGSVSNLIFTTPSTTGSSVLTLSDGAGDSLVANVNVASNGPPVVNLEVSSSINNYNIYQQAGSPAEPVVVNVTVDSGVVIGSASTSAPALDTGTFPAGSVVNLINNGAIEGAGGTGGAGGGAYYGGGGGGAPGGPAMTLETPITITNAGYILGGGGGGGGGVGFGVYGYAYGGGGGGGGGCGTVGGGGGGGGSGDGVGYGGNSGGSGSASGPGGGGGGAVFGVNGGAGGCWGQSGATGGGSEFAGGAGGGAGGAAIISNGQPISWVSGSSSPNVQGALN